jgi:GntR family transcriptional regulator/MocR family aminotransferase
MKTAPSAPLLFVELDRARNTPLHVQIYEQVKDAVLRGDLAPGARLPSSRLLARQWAVSRNTVLNAYELLRSEDYITSVRGSATQITRQLNIDSPDQGQENGLHSEAETFIGKTSRTVQLLKLKQTHDRHHQRGMRAFRPGLPEIDQFPFKFWNRILGRFWRNPPEELLVGGEINGYLPLRNEIAAYLGAVRGVRCQSHQIFITSGAQQAIDLVARTILDPGDKVWVEDPGYGGLETAFQAAGGIVCHIGLDNEGIDVAAGNRTAPDTVLAAVTPSHQYPLGITMSLNRRLELLEWASRNGAWIIEDDFDSEYRYSGKPVSALQGLDRSDRVIYIGTFSKVLFPALRLGYVIVPDSLIEPVSSVKLATDDHPSIALQPALHQFFREGHFNSHIRKMRKLYLQRQERLIELVGRNLGGFLEIGSSEAGMHLVAELKTGEESADRALNKLANKHGLIVPAVSNYCRNARISNKVLLGYAGLSEDEMARSVEKLSEITATLSG